MAKGNKILINGEGAHGRFVEGVINTGETPKPGQVVQIDPTQAQTGGRFVMKLYDRGFDGERPAGPFLVLLEDVLRGLTADDAYAAGDRCFAYAPLPGDELNLLYKNETGTADDVVAGDVFVVDDGTGKMTLTGTVGTTETEVAMALEALTDPTADTLVWSVWSGH